ncbi:MAG: GNAT family N-acetyltransferase [Agarilytica sp.]
MSIRAYTQIDFPWIADIYDRSKLDELKYEDKTFTLLPLEKDETRFRELMESEIFVYQSQDQISGFGAIYGNEIRALFVHPDFRGDGIGKKLIEFLLLNAQGQAHLFVASTNQPAKSLYQRYGFSVSDTFETTYNKMTVMAQKMVCKAAAKNIRSVN